jgi:hypothetical protein
MKQHQPPSATHGEPTVYQIKVKGLLSEDWCVWFDGMTITQDATGATLITGLVADQAALHGLLRKVRDAGMPLLSVICIESE